MHIPPEADPPAHVTCDACWEANPTLDRQTPVKTLPCPKLCLWAVNISKLIINTQHSVIVEEY